MVTAIVVGVLVLLPASTAVYDRRQRRRGRRVMAGNRNFRHDALGRPETAFPAGEVGSGGGGS